MERTEGYQRRQEEEEAEREPGPCRILILGDGNFSFSLALARALLRRRGGSALTAALDRAARNDPATAAAPSGSGSREGSRTDGASRPRKPRAREPGQFDIVATSFDGPLDLLGKYPESCGIVASLRSLGVTVLHNVDATALDARVVAVEEEKERDVSPDEKRWGAEAAEGGRRSNGVLDGRRSNGDVNHRAEASVQFRQYHHVIFNHPHTGTEDMRRHRSFLGHFFHAVVHARVPASRSTTVYAPRGGKKSNGGTVTGSARATAGDGSVSILAPGGAIHVTLAGDQPERWGLREQAARHGFSLAHRLRFPGERIDGYMTKRHQTGRSFQSRSLDSETLSFTRTGVDGRTANTPCNGLQDAFLAAAGDSGAAAVEAGAAHHRPGWAQGQDEDEEVGDACGESREAEGEIRQERNDAVGSVKGKRACTITRTLPPWLWPEVDMCGKVSDQTDEAFLGEGGRTGGDDSHGNADEYVGTPRSGERCRNAIKHDGTARARAADAASKVLLPELCELCGKRYKTAQALRTHTRQLHELGQEGGVALTVKKERPCPHCDRIFTTGRALDQHVSAKHRGDNVDIKPDWFVGSIYRLEPPAPEVDDVAGGDPEGRCTDDETHEERRKEAAGGREVFKEERERANSATDMGETAGPLPPPLPPSCVGGASECWVCGYWFWGAEDARQHLDNLRPQIEGAVTRYECDRCTKEFGSRRALLQHANFCGGGSGKVGEA